MGLFNFFRKKENVNSSDEAITKIHKVTKNVRVSQKEIDELNKKKNLRHIQKNIKNPEEYSLRSNALYYAMNGNFKKSIKLCDKAIKINPKGAYNFYLRGRSKGDLDFYDEGLKDLNTAIKLDNKYADAYLERARIKVKKEDIHFGFLMDYKDHRIKIDKKLLEKIKDIMKDFDKGLLLDPNDFKAFEQRGLLKLQLEDYTGALQDFEKSLKLIPKTEYIDKEEEAFSIKENIYLAKLYQLKGGTCSECKKKIKNFEPNKNAFTPVLGDGPEIDLSKKPILICNECKLTLK